MLFVVIEDAEGIDSVSGKTFKVDTFQFTPEDVESETAVVDGLGQRLRLSLENTRGGGGNRRIAVFCQYWILNTTEHCLRYKQENSNNFVSGTAHSPDRDGSAQLYGNEFLIQKSRLGDLLTNRTIFGGKPGALATFPGQCRLPPSRVAHLLDSNLAHEELSQLAFMFDFQEGSILTIGQQKLCVQLGDGTGTTTYESNWSRGFSLESVGIPQIVWYVRFLLEASH